MVVVVTLRRRRGLIDNPRMTRPPRALLTDVAWSFAEPVPHRAEQLVDAAVAYAAEIDAPDPTPSLLLALPVSDLYVAFERPAADDRPDQRDDARPLRVVGMGGRLTGAELLWEVHVACHDHVGQGDDHYFEGFDLADPGSGREPPTYRLLLGS